MEDYFSDSSSPDASECEGVSKEMCVLRSRIISCVSRTNAYFRSQQKDEADLSRTEKKKIASSLLDGNPAGFLDRYSKYLQPQHSSYFDRFRGKYEVDYHLDQLEKTSGSRSNVSVKNRRYQAMKQMIDRGDYFSMPEMKSRNPLLFEHLVGQYMSPEEKEEMQPSSQLCQLSTVLMAHMDRDQYSSTRRKEQEAEQMAWDEELSEEEEDEEEEKEEDESEQLASEERNMFQEEFVSTMYRSFLEGRDKEFDYATVDDNSQYDDVALQERDAEDRYFDADD